MDVWALLNKLSNLFLSGHVPKGLKKRPGFVGCHLPGVNIFTKFLLDLGLYDISALTDKLLYFFVGGGVPTGGKEVPCHLLSDEARFDVCTDVFYTLSFGNRTHKLGNLLVSWVGVP